MLVIYNFFMQLSIRDGRVLIFFYSRLFRSFPLNNNSSPGTKPSPSSFLLVLLCSVFFVSMKERLFPRNKAQLYRQCFDNFYICNASRDCKRDIKLPSSTNEGLREITTNALLTPLYY